MVGTNKFSDPVKQQAREQIWRIIAREKHAPLSRVLFFPGSKRYELDTVLKFGFRPENIYMVEKNLAVKANFTRSAKAGVLPPVEHFFRKLLSEAAIELVKNKISLDAAHLDFCSNCESNEMFIELQKFLRSGVLKNNGILAITAFAMREHDIDLYKALGVGYSVNGRSDITTRFSVLPKADQGRLYRLWQMVGMEMKAIDFGRYFNKLGNSQMLWAVFRVSNLERRI